MLLITQNQAVRESASRYSYCSHDFKYRSTIVLFLFADYPAHLKFEC